MTSSPWRHLGNEEHQLRALWLTSSTHLIYHRCNTLHGLTGLLCCKIAAEVKNQSHTQQTQPIKNNPTRVKIWISWDWFKPQPTMQFHVNRLCYKLTNVGLLCSADKAFMQKKTQTYINKELKIWCEISQTELFRLEHGWIIRRYCYLRKAACLARRGWMHYQLLLN